MESSISTIFELAIVLHTNGSNLTAFIGRSYELSCEASNARFHEWFHNGTAIRDYSPFIAGLIIINAVFSDAGKYECRLTNHLDRYIPRNVSIQHLVTVTGNVNNRLSNADIFYYLGCNSYRKKHNNVV